MKALSTTNWIELIDKKKFAKVVLDENSETFVVYMIVLESKTLIYPSQTTQIPFLQRDNISTNISTKYSNYIDVFSIDLVMELSKNINMNYKHTIKLIDRKQPLYRPIYALSPIKLESLKTYIETNLKTGFIWPSKFLASTPILFDKKSDDNLYLYVDYRSLNNLTMKNQYPLSLIGKSLNCLGRTKRFTQLDLTSAYYQM